MKELDLYVWKIEKMAAQLSSHQVHYEKVIRSLFIITSIFC